MVEDDRLAGPAGSERPGPEPPVRIKVSWCKACGLCVAYCDRGVLALEQGRPQAVHAERCGRCLRCEEICPDFAIQVLPADSGGAAEEAGG